MGIVETGRELIEYYANQIVEEVLSRFEPPWEGPEVRQFITERVDGCLAWMEDNVAMAAAADTSCYDTLGYTDFYDLAAAYAMQAIEDTVASKLEEKRQELQYEEVA